MSIESIPSYPITWFDVPDVAELVGTCVYNFFTVDEMINESGDTAVNGNLSSSLLKKGTADIGNLNARFPRYVKLDFYVEDTAKKILATKNTSIKDVKAEVMAALQDGDINSEESQAGTGFTTWLFGNENLKVDLTNFWARRFTTLTGTDLYVSGSALDMLQDPSILGTFPNPDFLESILPADFGLEADDTTFLSSLSQRYYSATINGAYSEYMFKPTIEKGLAHNTTDPLRRFFEAQKTPSEDLAAKWVSDDEYVLDLPFTSITECKSPDFVAEAEVVGYLFEKERIFKGKSYTMPPIFVAGSGIRTAYDSQVAYGQVYKYVARSIVKFRIPITDWKSGETFIGEFFWASRASSPVSVPITENRRPNPPSDISYYYNFDEDNLIITWAPPVNPQRDVKYIQIYRRPDTTKAFTLIAHYDFDDSIIAQESPEDIDLSLVRETPMMPCTFVDYEWDKTKSYIYSIVTIDARQLSSYYSSQTRVYFDSTSNKLRKEFISYQGAPKQYPNWFLKANFFSDCIKDSSHKEVKIYFNPETYTVVKAGGEEVPVFYSTDIDPEAKYLFQFINVDRLDEHQISAQITRQVPTPETDTVSTPGLARTRLSARGGFDDARLTGEDDISSDYGDDYDRP
jgi:hypothetical protein